MCCSYCGKEIGAFRLLRDSEFCCALHREKYGERLGRALHEIAAPAPAPAGLADFLIQMPLQQGKLTSTLTPRPTPGSRNRIRTGSRWPLTIDSSDARSDAPKEPAPVAASARVECPPRSERWMPTPLAEPVAALVQASAALAPADIPRAPRLAAGLGPAPLQDSSPAAGISACAASYSAQSIERTSVPPRMPALPCTAELDPLAAPDRPFEAPAVCQQMSTLAADPVFGYPRTSTAPAIALPVALERPDFALSAAAPHVPGIEIGRASCRERV